MSGLASLFAFPLGGSGPQSRVTRDDAIDLLIQLLPRGASKLYGLARRSGDVYNLLGVIGDAFFALAYTPIALLRQEIAPITAALKLSDYEQALGLSTTPTALTGSTAARRTQIVSKYRESGSFNLSNIRAIVAPLLGYANVNNLEIVECDRAALTALHTYSNTSGAVIGGSSSATQTVYVSDDGTLFAGAQVIVRLTSTNPEQLSFTLKDPSGVTVKTWAAGTLGAAAITSSDCYLSASAAATQSIRGDWSLTVDTGAAACTVVQWSLFAEGIAQGQTTGGAIFEWGVYADPALVTNPDSAAARAAIARIQPAWSIGCLLGSVDAYPDTTTGAHESIPDTFLPA